MIEPIDSRYDLTPFEPDDKKDDEPPPDLGNTDSPKLEVWKSRPSFDEAPKDLGQDGGGEKQAPGEEGSPSRDLLVNLQNLAGSLDEMLNHSRALVAQYELLRSKVLSSQDTVFGQEATVVAAMKPAGQAVPGGASSLSVAGNSIPIEDGRPSRWQKTAQDFGDRMNPMQQKVLQKIGVTLELVGEYIALANHSGQVYAEADRQSRFPEPPSGHVPPPSGGPAKANLT